MLITERKIGFFKSVNVYFAEKPDANIPDGDVVTFHTYKNWGVIKGFERENCFTTTIDLSQDINEIWRKIKRQHKRHIRRAEKDGTEVTVSNNYMEFHQILKKFLKEKKYTDLFGINTLSSQFMQKFGILLIAENQGKILGGNVYFHDGVNTLLACHAYQQTENTITHNKRIADANCYLHWKAMHYFKNLNILNYDLGELGSNEIVINHQMHGLDYFKRSFGGKVISLYKYRKYNSRFDHFLFHSWNYLRGLL